ncbi:hypothetical protein [Clostridium butyricum]
MKKFNFDILAKIIILISFSLFYLKILISKEILLYVHPRIIPFTILGICSMIIMAIFLISSLFCGNYIKSKVTGYFHV